MVMAISSPICGERQETVSQKKIDRIKSRLGRVLPKEHRDDVSEAEGLNTAESARRGMSGIIQPLFDSAGQGHNPISNCNGFKAEANSNGTECAGVCLRNDRADCRVDAFRGWDGTEICRCDFDLWLSGGFVNADIHGNQHVCIEPVPCDFAVHLHLTVTKEYLRIRKRRVGVL